ncbi:hypothetical protein HELRODRAFT_145646, partial [Helobdella robusta]|uniref:ISXO2-like transposase domain-containing protein n=1 Tax=Helobdella robusta TaxID=6412 RepID=T1EJL6_HELRO
LQLGGPGRIVQIDETLVSSNKRTRQGRTGASQQRWVFGGVDNLTKEAFLVEVPQRDIATLMPIIQQHILPGTSIWSDRWSAYNNLTQLTGLTHGIDFMAPTGVHSNVVENLWRCAREGLK